MSDFKPETAKHTPGPWRIGSLLLTNGGFPTRHPHYEIVSDKSLSWVAHVLCFSDANTGTKYEADASLIAAAPDLLGALEAVLGSDTECEGQSNGTVADVLRRTEPEVVDKAEAAIRKAKEGNL